MTVVSSVAPMPLLALRGLAVLTLAGIAVQFFLAGMTVFGAGNGWEAHAAMGGALGMPILLLFGVSFHAGLRTHRPLAGILFGVYLVQVALAGIGQVEPLIGALHPVNGLLLGFVAARLTRRLFGSGADTGPQLP